MRRSVTDFIDFHMGSYHWYTFNIADSAIVVGAGLRGARTFSRLAAPSHARARLARVDFTMHPILFQSAPSPSTPRRAGADGRILGLWYARRQAPRRASIPRNLESRHLHDFRRADRLEDLADSQRLALLCRESRRNFQHRHVSIRRNFYGGLLGAILAIFFYTRFQKLPLLPVLDISAAALPLEPCDRAPGLLRGRMLLRQADVASLGRHVHRSKPPRGSRARRCTLRCIRRNSTKPPPNF